MNTMASSSEETLSRDWRTGILKGTGRKMKRLLKEFINLDREVSGRFLMVSDAVRGERMKRGVTLFLITA